MYSTRWYLRHTHTNEQVQWLSNTTNATYMKNQNWSPFPLIPTVSWLLKQKQTVIKGPSHEIEQTKSNRNIMIWQPCRYRYLISLSLSADSCTSAESYIVVQRQNFPKNLQRNLTARYNRIRYNMFACKYYFAVSKGTEAWDFRILDFEKCMRHVLFACVCGGTQQKFKIFADFQHPSFCRKVSALDTHSMHKAA